MKKTGFWITLIVLLVLVSLASLLLLPRKGQGGTAVVRHDGVVLYTIDLKEVKEPYTFRVEEKNGEYNTVSVEKDRVCVSSADCPDQVCVRQGWIGTAGTPIVCLPHALVIEITGGENGPDAILH